MKIKKFGRKARVYTKFGGSAEQVRVIPKKQREQKPPAHTAASSAEIDEKMKNGEYADGFGISFNKEEFIIDFLQTAGTKPRVHTRIITSPAHAKRLRNLLKEKCR